MIFSTHVSFFSGKTYVDRIPGAFSRRFRFVDIFKLQI